MVHSKARKEVMGISVKRFIQIFVCQQIERNGCTTSAYHRDTSYSLYTACVQIFVLTHTRMHYSGVNELTVSIEPYRAKQEIGRLEIVLSHHWFHFTTWLHSIFLLFFSLFKSVDSHGALKRNGGDMGRGEALMPVRSTWAGSITLMGFLLN